MSTLVLCPSRGRPKAAAATLSSFLATRWDPESRLVFLVDTDDPTRGEYPAGTHRVRGGSLGNALREVASDTRVLGTATSIGVIGDDVRFRTPGWDRMLDDWLTAGIGIAWGDDGWDHPWPKKEKASHWWLSRPIVDAMGLCPPTRHYYMDDYWAQLGWASGCARYFPHILIEHLHPMAGKGEMDPTYDRSRRFIPRDKLWWQRWQARGKGADMRRLRALTEPKLRVFADWHHPALWEALSILFEDRFGWQLYSPIGTSWKYNGWRMTGATPGWTADDYLDFPDAVQMGDHWERTEAEYPGRPRKMVTVEQFEAAPWDVVVASLGAHQRTFAALARKRGARFVHHIGDAHRRLERIPGQVVLASAKVPGALIHHQEFDTSLFGFQPVQERHAVASFMLRLDETSGPYRWLAEADGVDWFAVKAESPRDRGYLAPMSKVAERMQAAGFVWHDKAGYKGARPGDGYGHVLFAAAHAGRPLIGHASYYAGLMGEPLWEDGQTCIDLDRHAPPQALRLWRDITADPERHDAMAVAIRERFESQVDFDAEAQAVKAALA